MNRKEYGNSAFGKLMKAMQELKQLKEEAAS